LNKPLHTDQYFIKIWNQSPSLWAIMERLGMTKSSIVTRAWKLRKKGFKLQKFRNGEGE